MDFKDKNDWQKWSSSQSGMSDGMLKRLWDASENYKEDYQPDVEAGLKAFKMRMAKESASAQIVTLHPRRNYLFRIAAGLAILTIGILVFKSYLGHDDKLQIVVSPANRTLEKTLPDGSQIALNKSSELTYNEGFSDDERRVKLEGEAFFEVKRDEVKPFVIEAANAKIVVLGTSFNVRSYPKEDMVEVYVVSGSVRVEIPGAGQGKKLLKGDWLRYDRKAAKIEYKVDHAGLPIAWHSGVINFKGQPLPVVLEGMERLYGVSFELKISQASECLQTLTVQDGALDEALEALKLSCPELRFVKKLDTSYSVSGTCCE